MQRTTLPIVLLFLLAAHSHADDFELNGHTFTLADGLSIELAVPTDLVERPICADFDEQGRLYVAESSGSNDPSKVQLEQKPHWILRLEDSDDDGVFDKRTKFADNMMFPEGTLWADGSLYVAAPPHIWKLTDTDDDGVADQREVWFDAKTLTGCANDLHGPFRGPDGYIYWCKGAFAEQTHELMNGETLVTKASHVFRRHIDGGPVESIMAGGMDNPVEIAWTRSGELIFSSTFVVHPGGGLRDGLIHAVHGGVYGKDHHVLDGHPRTGDLMPVMTHLGGAAAPCGLVRLQSHDHESTDAETLLCASFNMHRIFRVDLTPKGSSFESAVSDFVVSDQLDFHPTDVMEDADGSLLIVDTGGWYKLCCPTSQLWKPDVPGAIYRVRFRDADRVNHPRGESIVWSELPFEDLDALLTDPRFAVRESAILEMARRCKSDEDASIAFHELSLQLFGDGTRSQAAPASAEERLRRRNVIRVATQFLKRDAIILRSRAHPEDSAQARLAGIGSLSPDSGLIPLDLSKGTSRDRRLVAEAMGRTGDAQHVAALLEATAHAHDDRYLEHSLIYAVIEINDPEEATKSAEADDPSVRRAALLALDQMRDGELRFEQLSTALFSESERLRATAWWITEQHPEWAAPAAHALVAELNDADASARNALVTNVAPHLSPLLEDITMRAFASGLLVEPSLTTDVRRGLLAAFREARLTPAADGPLETVFSAIIGETIFAENIDETIATVRSFRELPADSRIAKALLELAASAETPPTVRLAALAAVPGHQRDLSPDDVEFLMSYVPDDQPVRLRGMATDVLTSARQSKTLLTAIADRIHQVGPLELTRLVQMFQKTKHTESVALLITNLQDTAAATTLSPELVEGLAALVPSDGASIAAPLLERIRTENAEKLSRLETILSLVEGGDARHGQEIFQGTKAACSACHAAGYLGGKIGPDLTRIGRARSERDLLESILYPSASLVRSYEPETFLLDSGKIITGLVTRESNDSLTIQIDATREVTIDTTEIEERAAGTVSVMPAGLDKQFSDQELADLVAFLKTAG